MASLEAVTLFKENGEVVVSGIELRPQSYGCLQFLNSRCVLMETDERQGKIVMRGPATQDRPEVFHETLKQRLRNRRTASGRALEQATDLALSGVWPAQTCKGNDRQDDDRLPKFR